MSDFVLTPDQKAAEAALAAFFADAAATSFCLDGGAGVGKTVLVSRTLKAWERKPVVVCATPTHKATNVLRRKLDAADIEWVRGYDDYNFDGFSIVTGTTAQLLGIQPAIADDQTEKERTFRRVGKGILQKVTPRLVVIDEVSMLSWPDLVALVKRAKERRFKVLVVGDAGQLPPVKAQAIPFEQFKHRATLRQIVRQGEDSAIPQLAWAVRDGGPWQVTRGKGIERTPFVLDAFLERVVAPGEAAEEDRDVFVAYRNLVVNAAQEKACQKVYGHGRLEFRPGELVLAANSLYRRSPGGPPVLLCANQDELVVQEFLDSERHPVYGVPVILRPARERGTFRAYYLSPEDHASAIHPYNVELAARAAKANDLQTRWKHMAYTAPGRLELDKQRKAAWADFFELRDQTVIAFSHPFAITSHKSQGSTYRTVFADTLDLARFSRHALYVAVTRPRESLVLGGAR